MSRWTRPFVPLVEVSDLAGTAGARSEGKLTPLGAPYAGKYLSPLLRDRIDQFEGEYGRGTLICSSAFRSVWKQIDLLPLRQQGIIVATPGRSAHQYGWAVDLNRRATLQALGIDMTGFREAMRYPNKPIEELDRMLKKYHIFPIDSETWHKQMFPSTAVALNDTYGHLMHPDDAAMAEILDLFELDYSKVEHIREFQEMTGCSVDGVVGPKTRFAGYYASLDYGLLQGS
jgi:hypothetical protein